MNKRKILNTLLIVTSLFGYLEWGNDQASFLFEMEVQILKGLFSDFNSVAHPLILIPLFGQIILVMTLFQNVPNKKLSYLGIACLGILLGLMFFIGIISGNLKILLSTLPFLATAIFSIINLRSRD